MALRIIDLNGANNNISVITKVDYNGQDVECIKVRDGQHTDTI